MASSGVVELVLGVAAEPLDGVGTCGRNFIAIGRDLFSCTFHEFTGHALASEDRINVGMIDRSDTFDEGEGDLSYHIAVHTDGVDSFTFGYKFHKLVNKIILH